MASVEILAGPSKWDLMLALFDVDHFPTPDRTVVFRIMNVNDEGLETFNQMASGGKRENGSVLAKPMSITSLTRRGGTSDEWEFRGTCFLDQDLQNSKYFYVKGYYSTLHRRGFIEIRKEQD